MAIPDDVTPQSPIKEQPVIGLIGMGAMGTMYATHFVNAGWKKCVLCGSVFIRPTDRDPNRIYVCDLPAKYDALKEKYKGTTLPRLKRSLAPLAYVLIPRCPCDYGLTRWSSRLQGL